MQTGRNAALGQAGNWGTEELSDLLCIDMHKQGKTKALYTNTATPQTPTGHEAHFQLSSVFQNGHVSLGLTKGMSCLKYIWHKYENT